jgi:5-methylcytosine-specific restriction endonuclease McrA
MSERREFSTKTKLKAFAACGGLCQRCSAKLSVGNIESHHDRECTMGGDRNPENCVALCKSCHAAITGTRAAVIAKSNRVRNKHIGAARRSRHPMPGSKDTNLKRTFRHGTVKR